jgi:hypothetical protein
MVGLNRGDEALFDTAAAMLVALDRGSLRTEDVIVIEEHVPQVMRDWAEGAGVSDREAWTALSAGDVNARASLLQITAIWHLRWYSAEAGRLMALARRDAGVCSRGKAVGPGALAVEGTNER